MRNYILVILVFTSLCQSIILAQAVCNQQRYIDDLFSVTTTSNMGPYGTADALNGPFYTNQSNTSPQDLFFDFYEPTGDTLSKRPLIIMAFGGSFLAGSKTQPELVAYCEAMTKKGYCVASIDYRLGFSIFSSAGAIRAVYRGAQDFNSAVRYFREFASTYKIDPDHIIGGGNSAGAFNALHTAYGDETDRIIGSILDPTFDTPDLGCFACTGNTYVQDPKPNAIVNLWGAIGEVSWMDPDEAAIISFHGLDDTTVSPNYASPYGYPIFPQVYGSNPIHNQANNIGLVNELNVYPGEGHELWGNAALATEIVDKSAIFLNDFLKPELPIIDGELIACNGSISSYTISNATDGSKYCWSVSGGMILSDNNDNITIQWNNPPSSGTVSVIERNCLDALSDQSTINITIDPTPPPVANFNFNYVGNGINFIDGSTGATTYFWDFGDGNTSTLSNPTHIYASNGTYLTTLTVTNSIGCSNTTTSLTYQNCQSTLSLTGVPTASAAYQTYNWIESNVPLALNSNVTFRAGDYIDLNNGFEVQSSDVFLAEIVGCSN